MKLAFLIIFTINSIVFAVETHSQNNRISLSAESSTLLEILSSIEKQTDYLFVYDNSEIDTNQKKSVDVKEQSITDVLNIIFRNSDIQFALEGHNVMLMKGKKKKEDVVVLGQQQKSKKQISGLVTDQFGDPIIGANILEKGTANGTITDIDGKFMLTIEEDAILHVTYIGFIAQNIQTNKDGNIKIALVEDTQRLDEVVVVGFGVAKKSDLTGTVARADLNKLQESPNVNILSALQGLIPGLNVGAVTEAGKTPELSIRGRTSISGSTSPLLVLDGIIYRGELIDINPSDIESIDVLKDASAAAIYGSEASNGVILITSKQGTAMSKPIIEYSGSFSYQEASNLSKMRPGNRADFLRKIGDRYLSESRIGDDMREMNPSWDPTTHLMDKNVIDGYANGTDTDWYDLLTNNTPYIMNHNVGIRGKSELSGYYFSVGYTDQKNLIINDVYKRYNIRINLDTKIRDWLKIGTQSFFTASNTSGVSPGKPADKIFPDKSAGDISSNKLAVMKLPPLATPWDENGNLIKQPYKDFTNPLLQIDEGSEIKRYNIMGNFYAEIDFPFLKGLKYRMNISQNLIFNKDFNFNPQGENFQGEAYKKNNSQYNWTVDNILSYNNTFGKHNVSGTFVYGVEERKYESTEAWSKIFLNNSLGYNSLQVGQKDQQSAKSEAWKESSLYAMLRLSYIYNDKYIFTGTVRRDGFSGFGSNHKFGTFPSAAFAWRVSEEDFMSSQRHWLDNLKLRLSYGINGNRSLDRYQTLAKMGYDAGYLYGDGASPEQIQWIKALSNADLKWETTSSFNIGVDYGFLNGRVFGDIEYYSSRTKNLLYEIKIPEINGLDKIPMNIGKMGNHGVEFTVTGIPVKTKDFSWSITFNYSLNRNKIIKILGIDADGDGKEDDLISDKIFINKPYGVVYDYNIIGMWQIADKNNGKIPTGFDYGTYKIEDINNDGKYDSENDRKILGYTDPSYRFSIQNTLNYKNWELKFFINSIQGGKNRYYGQPGKDLPNPDNIYQLNLFNFNYWTPENTNARYRQIGYYSPVAGHGFSPYIQRNFVRLQDVTLSYNFPSKLLRKVSINRLKVFVTGKNLLTFTDWDGWDPETDSGLSLEKSPLMRSYSVGLNVEF